MESRFRPFHLVAPGFEQEATARVGQAAGLGRSALGPVAPFAAVELQVADGSRGVVAAGLAADDDHLLATYDPARRRVAVEVRRTGRTRLLRQRRLALPDSFRLAYVLCAGEVTVLVDTGHGWRPVLVERKRLRRLLDLRRPELLDRFRYAWGTTSGSAEVGAMTAGLFGMAGLRDPRQVQHADGRPFVRDGRRFLTFTCAGMGGFAQAHWAVFAFDTADPTRLEQVAKIFTHRDGLLLGDHAGQLVRDDEHDRWLVATSSWGDFTGSGVHARHAITSADLLGGVHVLETRPLNLPTTMSSWDPGLTRIDGRWHVSFVQSPSQRPFDFHPALAVGPAGGGPFDALELVGAAEELHQCEGPILARIQDEWRMVTSDGHRRSYPVFTLGMQRAGALRAPYPSNIPHPQILTLDDGEHLLVTFDGTPFGERLLGYGTHGDVVVMRARPR